MEIRRAMPQDAEEFIRFTKHAGSETDNLTFGAEGIGRSAEQAAEYFTSPGSVVYLACEGSRILGAAGFTRESIPRMAHRGSLAIMVLKEAWGQGAGSALMEQVISYAECTGAEIISLEVRTDNERAIGLYRKYGFETVGTFRGFMKKDGKLIDCLIMERIKEEAYGKGR